MGSVNEMVNGQPAELLCTTSRLPNGKWRVVDARTGEVVVEKPTYAEAMQGMADWVNSQAVNAGSRIA